MSDEGGRPAKSLAEALDGFLKSAGLLEVSREKLCPLVWGEVVGAWYRRFTHITRVRDGVVYVRCDSAPRANQLQLDAPQIIERLNERLGGDYIREIRASSTGTGHPAQRAAAAAEADAPTDADLDAIELDQAEVERIRAAVAKVAEELRESIERILVDQAKLRVWQAGQGYTRCKGCGGYYRGGREYCYACDPPSPPPRAGGEEGLSPYWDPQ